MLVKFSVSNYKNFVEPITIDFTQTRDYQFNTKCVNSGLLSKIIIYGPNASGKSNFGFALFDIVGLLTDKNTNTKQKDKHSFLNADCLKEWAEFSYTFQNRGHFINYLYRKTDPDTICYEELRIDNKLIFSYDFLSKQFDLRGMSAINADTLNFEYYNDNLPVLRYIANNTSQPHDSHVRFLMDFVSRMLWFRSLQENGYIGFKTGAENITDWIVNNNLVGEYQKFLNTIAGIDIELESVTVNTPNATKVLFEQHARNPLVFEGVASNGTRALELLFYWSKQFNNVSFLFMDEFDAFYHFELARNIINYIVALDNVQAIFTTHNSYLASNAVLRPDCYFLLQNGTLKSFADSTERELREGHNIEKMLRNGEFNAKT